MKRQTNGTYYCENEGNGYKLQAIDERVDCEDHFSASLVQERSFRILTQK